MQKIKTIQNRQNMQKDERQSRRGAIWSLFWNASPHTCIPFQRNCLMKETQGLHAVFVFLGT